MSEEQKPFYLYIDGKPVPVTEQIYREYHHFQRKEKYFTCDLKAQQFICDQDSQTVVFTPGREESLELLLRTKHEFIQDEPPLEERIVLSAWLESALATLSDNERYIVCEVVMKQRTEREVGKELGVSQNTIHYHKTRALDRLRKFLEKDF